MRFPHDSELSVGRSANSDFRMFSPHVSRTHASLKRSNDEYFVKDENSLSGVHVNGSRIVTGKWITLTEGDEIEFGRPELEEMLTTMKLNDRFVYFVKRADPLSLDKKVIGPWRHLSDMWRVAATKRKLSHKIEVSAVNNVAKHENSTKPEEVKRLKLMPTLDGVDTDDNKHDTVKIENKIPNCEKTVNVTPQEATDQLKQVSEPKTENTDNPTSKEPVLPSVDNEKCIWSASVKFMNPIKVPVISTKMSDMEQENKRLKLELEQKELALKEEIEKRNKKLEEEQQKIAEKIEQAYKSKFEQREEEFEMRLMLEKDIAVEDCKADIEKASTSIESVVNTMENELQCSICSELFIVSTTLNCAHTFCEYCISQWREIRDLCPVCRKPIENTTRSLVLDNYIDKALENLSQDRRKFRETLVSERKKLMEERRKSVSTNQTRRRIARNNTVASRGRGRGRNNTHGTIRGGGILGRFRRIVPQPRLVSRTPILISSDEADSSSAGISDESNSSDDSEDYHHHEHNYNAY